MKLKLNKKTGFKAVTLPVEIFDFKRKKPFYIHKGHGSREFYFNLPKGEYLIKNKVIKLENPIPVILPQLPEPEKKLKFPKSVKVEIDINKNKASIWTGLNKILIDKSIFKKPLPEIVFILFHEAGHYLYTSEEKCDLFAIREMLILGYNKSQCFEAIKNALGNHDSSNNRKICAFKKLFPDERI